MPNNHGESHVQRLASAAALLLISVIGYQVLLIERSPTSQSASVAAVIDKLNPPSHAGLRADVFVDVPVSWFGCNRRVKVWIVLSGLPEFWANAPESFDGVVTLGIGLRTSLDESTLRVADWAGYQLPAAAGNLSQRVTSPRRSGAVSVQIRSDSSTGARLTVVKITGWRRHWTPLVVEFMADWTSTRAYGSCHLVLPDPVAIDSSTVGDANAAAFGWSSVFERRGEPGHPNAITYGRVMVRTTGRFLEAATRPAPTALDRNPWPRGFGRIGEEVATWECSAPIGREHFPAAGISNEISKEVALPVSSANIACGGVAAITTVNAETYRQLGLLIAGGLFALALEQLLRHLPPGIRELRGSLARRRGVRRPPQE